MNQGDKNDKNDICGCNIFFWFELLVNCWRFTSNIFTGKCSLLTLQNRVSCYYSIIWKSSLVFWVVQTYNHTHKNTHIKLQRELLRCSSGRETKADRSEQRYNQPWVLRKKHFAPSFQSYFTSSHLHTIFHHHHQPPTFPTPLCRAQCGGWWCWHKHNQFRVWIDKPAAGVARDPQHKLRDGAHVEAVLRCRVQLNPKVFC